MLELALLMHLDSCSSVLLLRLFGETGQELVELSALLATFQYDEETVHEQVSVVDSTVRPTSTPVFDDKLITIETGQHLVEDLLAGVEVLLGNPLLDHLHGELVCGELPVRDGQRISALTGEPGWLLAEIDGSLSTLLDRLFCLVPLFRVIRRLDRAYVVLISNGGLPSFSHLGGDGVQDLLANLLVLDLGGPGAPSQGIRLHVDMKWCISRWEDIDPTTKVASRWLWRRPVGAEGVVVATSGRKTCRPSDGWPAIVGRTILGQSTS